MRVKSIITFQTARGGIPSGTILNVPDHLIAKLAGKVEPIPLDPLVDLLQDRQRGLDALGDWTGCREWLNSQASLLAETISARRAVDQAFREKDSSKVRHSIEGYYQVWRLVFDGYRQHSRSGTETPVCYACKGTDFWKAGSEEYPHMVCRKCHPPAPGAEV